ncbi:YceI family protein [Daejeonella oryzae]|uniref:YceI family protein n=1 Tax=Daejeonella oryzae TaxID=1122943 RepID=UPI00040E54D2|nr:YceI family protein [Daejeonella oryzae]
MKIKIVLLVFFLSCSQFSLFAQKSILSTSSGEIVFFSKAPLEDIEAKNNRVISMLNISNREIVVRVPIRQFQFRNKLMQQHFNENYMESEKFPYATFKGLINELIDFQKPGTYDVSASGILNIHGVSRKRTLNGKLTILENSTQLTTTFNVLLTDHKIKVPKLVFNKIAETIAVSTSFSYSPYEK